MDILDGIGMHDGWGWVIGSAMMLLFWGTISWGSLYLWRRVGQVGSAKPGAEILRERFARGEIDRAEFEERLAGLRRNERR